MLIGKNSLSNVDNIATLLYHSQVGAEIKSKLLKEQTELEKVFLVCNMTSSWTSFQPQQ